MAFYNLLIKKDNQRKDGDTLEISESNDNDNNSDRIKISESSIKSVKPQVSDAVLSKMSKAKLQQMLASGKITRQQYNKAIKR